MPDRRFPPAWTIEEHNDACFIVRDNNGQARAYFYFEDKPGRRSRRSCLPRTRPAAWPRTSPSGLTCCAAKPPAAPSSERHCTQRLVSS
jgi:hypothetical protein